MKTSKTINSDSSTEKILQCYIHKNGNASCEGCDLSEECKKFKKYMKKKAKHPIVPSTHTANILKGDVL
jgi:hypothetical protein